MHGATGLAESGGCPFGQGPGSFASRWYLPPFRIRALDKRSQGSEFRWVQANTPAAHSTPEVPPFRIIPDEKARSLRPDCMVRSSVRPQPSLRAAALESLDPHASRLGC